MTTKEELMKLLDIFDSIYEDSKSPRSKMSKGEIRALKIKYLRYTAFTCYTYLIGDYIKMHYYTPSTSQKLFLPLEKVYNNFLCCSYEYEFPPMILHNYTEIIDMNTYTFSWKKGRGMAVTLCSYLPEYNTCRKYKVV